MKFQLNPDFTVDTSEAPWKTEGLRIGLWGGSGSGKSNTAALFAEQFLSQSGTVVIFEPRAEYHTLKEKWDVVVCGGPYAKDVEFVPSSPSTYAKAVVEQGISLIFYTTDVEDETNLIEFISKFLYYLLKYNEVAKRPILLVVEETQEYAPMSTKGRVSPPWVFSRMIKAFKTASIDARKLNIVPIAISPRPQEVNYTIRQLCNLTFYGKFSPQDIHYVESQCLKYYAHSFYKGSDLLHLETGQFAAITSGQAIPLLTVTQPRLTKHGAETPKLTYVTPRKEETLKAVTALTQTIQVTLEKERLKQSELEKERQRAKKLEDVVESQNKKIEFLTQQSDTLGKIRIEPSKPRSEETELLRKRAYEAEMKLSKIRDVIADKGDVMIPARLILKPPDVYGVWESKLPSLCAKRMFKFLFDNKEAKYTKSQLGVSLGYKTSSGTFGGAIAFLKQNNLIRYDGKFLWVE